MSKKLTFKGGIYQNHCKAQTERLATEEFAPPPVAIIPMSQHLGAPAKPVVEKGERVLVGQLVGEAAGNVSANVHASIAGTVISVKPFQHANGRLVMSVEIENDGTDEHAEFDPIGEEWRDAARGELVKKIAECGVVGMGGAAFPTHIKLSPPANKTVDTLIINGSECEPYLTDDHRIMLERAEDILEGVLILKKILGAKDVFFGIEANKPNAINYIAKRAEKSQYKDINIVTLKSKYPQGGEKMLINAITKRKVPSGGLPMDAGCVVINVGTALAVFEGIVHGVPLYRRVVSVMGDGVRAPKNLLVRVGTPVRSLLEHCKANLDGAKKVIMGGPMMGVALSDIGVPIIKATSGVLVLNRTTEPVKKYPCVNCGHCVSACPMRLVPSRLAKFVEHENYEDAFKWNIMDCIECGTCAYTCPAKINLVHFYKLGKLKIRGLGLLK